MRRSSIVDQEYGLRPHADAAGVRIAATAVHTKRNWLARVAELAGHGALVPNR